MASSSQSGYFCRGQMRTRVPGQAKRWIQYDVCTPDGDEGMRKAPHELGGEDPTYSARNELPEARSDRGVGDEMAAYLKFGGLACLPFGVVDLAGTG